MKLTIIRTLAGLALILSLGVVTLGAYTRLTAAGLGCPDWPGCYGHMVVQPESVAFDDTNVIKAWTEMAHRYVAGTLGLLIIALVSAAWSSSLRAERSNPALAEVGETAKTGLLRSARNDGVSRGLSLTLLALILFQAALGMWTVTLKLLPIVVMGHLLGGLSIVACLTWLFCRVRQPNEPTWQGTRLQRFALFAAIITFIQIALGGWVSANYAGIACVGFPTCNGQWLPSLDFSSAFHLFSPIGENYQGGLLDIGARITIQFVHRLGAVVTAVVLLALAYRLYAHHFRKSAWLVAGVVTAQFCLGIANVVWLLPLPIAVLHNGVAATLLASLVAVNFGLATHPTEETVA